MTAFYLTVYQKDLPLAMGAMVAEACGRCPRLMAMMAALKRMFGLVELPPQTSPSLSRTELANDVKSHHRYPICLEFPV